MENGCMKNTTSLDYCYYLHPTEDYYSMMTEGKVQRHDEITIHTCILQNGNQGATQPIQNSAMSRNELLKKRRQSNSSFVNLVEQFSQYHNMKTEKPFSRTISKSNIQQMVKNISTPNTVLKHDILKKYDICIVPNVKSLVEKFSSSSKLKSLNINMAPKSGSFINQVNVSWFIKKFHLVYLPSTELRKRHIIVKKKPL